MNGLQRLSYVWHRPEQPGVLIFAGVRPDAARSLVKMCQADTVGASRRVWPRLPVQCRREQRKLGGTGRQALWRRPPARWPRACQTTTRVLLGHAPAAQRPSQKDFACSHGQPAGRSSSPKSSIHPSGTYPYDLSVLRAPADEHHQVVRISYPTKDFGLVLKPTGS